MIRQLAKTISIIVALSPWYCGGLTAQTNIRTAENLQTSYWGIKAGMVSAKTQYAASTRGVENKYLKYRILYSFGGYYAHRIVGSLYLQAELLYAVKGVKFQALRRNFYGELIELKENQTLNYLEFPIIFNYVFKDSFIKPSVYAGVFGAHLLKVESDLGYDISNEFKPSDYGAIFGLAALMPMHGRYMVLEGRFESSFDNVVKVGYCAASDGYKNNSFSLMAGIAF